MKSPLLIINPESNIIQSQIDFDFFNKKTMAVETLTLSDMEISDNSLKLKRCYSKWDVNSTQHIDTTNDILDEQRLPDTVHTLETFIEPEPVSQLKVVTLDDVSIIQYFHYAIFNYKLSDDPIGFVKGSFNLSSALELQTVSKRKSIEHADNSNIIYIGCNLEAIELDPFFQKSGIGVSVSNELIKLGKHFYNNSLNQLNDSDLLKGIVLEPIFTIDIHSLSGYKLSNYMFNTFETMVFEELLNFIDVRYLRDAEFEI